MMSGTSQSNTSSTASSQRRHVIDIADLYAPVCLDLQRIGEDRGEEVRSGHPVHTQPSRPSS